MPPLQMCVSTLLIAGVNGTDAMQARPNTFLETGAGNASVSTPHCSRVWAGSGPGLGHRHGKTWVGNAVISPFTYAMFPTATEHTERNLWKKHSGRKISQLLVRNSVAVAVSWPSV